MTISKRIASASSGLLFAALVVAPGCQPAKSPPPAPPPPSVTVIQPVSYPVQSYHDYNGYLDSFEMVEIRARVKGYLEKVHFVDGTDVVKGQDLYTIDPREYEAMVARAEADIERAKADQANAEAQIALAEAELKRQESLGDAASASDKDKAVATLAANKALLKTAVANTSAGEAALRSAKLQLEYTKIKAPISGKINRTLVTQGNLVGQNEPTLLTTIVRIDKLYVYFDTAERDLVEYLQSLSTDTTEAVEISVGVTSEEGFPHKGKIDFRENRVDTGTGTVRIRGELDNPLAVDKKNRILYPGLYSRIRLPNGPRRNLPVIPEEALMTGLEGRYVYVVDENNQVIRRPVEIVRQAVWKASPPGQQVNGAWVVTTELKADSDDSKKSVTKPIQSIVAVASGLTVQDRIIVNGLQKARPGGTVNPEISTLVPPPEAP